MNKFIGNENMIIKLFNASSYPITLTIGGEASVSYNTAPASGAGIYIRCYTNFTMSGGSISNNSAYHGGGVAVGLFGSSNVTINLIGGSIANNTCQSNGSNIFYSSGVTFTNENGVCTTGINSK